MLQRLELVNFKGFQQFLVTFPSPAVLVGPNNAGKSTVITALRVAALMLRQGKRANASHVVKEGGESVRAHAFRSEQFDLMDENLRHEFRRVEPRFELHFVNGSSLKAVWPIRAQVSSYFIFRDSQGNPLEVARAVRDLFPNVGTVPPLGPVEQREEILGQPYAYVVT
jgi:predicted ATPase